MAVVDVTVSGGGQIATETKNSPRLTQVQARPRGRPRSQNKICKICGEWLILGVNARETSPGSGRPRATCNQCDNRRRYKPRNPKPTTLVFDIPAYSEIHTTRAGLGLPRIERIELKLAAKWRPPRLTLIQHERPNSTGMSAQIMKEYTDDDGKPHHYYDHVYCDECGGVVRYDKRGFLVCEDCGLFHSNSPTIEKETLFSQRARNITENERKRWPRVTTNRYGKFKSDGDASTFDRVCNQLHRHRLPDKPLEGYDFGAKVVGRRQKRRTSKEGPPKGWRPPANPFEAIDRELKFLRMRSRRRLYER
jgi:hypothetical protein